MTTCVRGNSLSETVNAVNEAYFFRQPISESARRDAARWIASRQGLPGAYGELFAGFPAELARGIQLFTGERVTSASARHILGEESCRALRLLESREPAAAAALTRATTWIAGRVDGAAGESPRNSAGSYCCGKCTVGLWRNILAGGFDRREHRLKIGVARLSRLRAGDGEWRTFPYWYTVLALTEIDSDEARRELRYAAKRLEAEAGRHPGSSHFARRRHEVARRALEQV